MASLTIRHCTSYHYREPVGLGPHRLMLRPRESHELAVISAELNVMPEATISWAQDVSGNAVATARFGALSDTLVVESTVLLRSSSAPWPVFDIAASAITYPFLYPDPDWIDLGALAIPQYPDPDGRLADWARAFVYGAQTDTLSLLKDLSAGVSGTIAYQSRDEQGTQTPLETLSRGWGSCRDFAVLLVEAARHLGFGARIVSGYLHNPDTLALGSNASGSTHAWAEIFLPGAGWITFDPTNQSTGGFNLIPVAVGRHIDQIMPVSGSFIGPTDAFVSMAVSVEVWAAQEGL